MPIPRPGEDFRSIPVSLVDITRRKRVEAVLFFQSTHDSLTGLFNRDEFERRLGYILNAARGRHRKRALCYLDLDQFKAINDICGNAAGDELLRYAGRPLYTIV